MAGVRRGVAAILKYLTPLYFVAVVVQIFLAGSGIFGIEEGQGLEEATTLDPHRDVGWLLAQLGFLLFLILSLLWWPRNKRWLGAYLVLAVALLIQPFLTEGSRWVGAFHPLNGILILGLLAWLSDAWWRGRIDDARAEAGAATVG